MKNNKKMPFIVIVSISIIVTLIYLSLVFSLWKNINEFFSFIKSFIAAGITLGLFYSLMPFKRPLLASFILSSTAPIYSSIIYMALVILIPNAHASIASIIPINSMIPVALMIPNIPLNEDDNMMIILILTLIIGIIFGLISIFGCYIGLTTKKSIKNYYLRNKFLTANIDNKKVELKAAKVGALATLGVGFISAITSVITTYIK